MSLRGRPVPAGLAYDEVYTAGRPGWSWSAGGIVTAIVAFVVSQVSVVLVYVVVFAIQDPSTASDRVLDLADVTSMTPDKFLFINASLIVTVPFMWAMTVLFHGLHPRWLLSVTARIRWRFLLASMGVALLTLILSILLGAVLPGSADDTDVSGPVNSFTTDSLQYLALVVLLTPLQSTAEEFAFRGYLTQAFGALFRRRWVTVLAPALIFACFHFPQSFTAFCDRFAFGVVSGILVIATGGLEAGIGYHVVNNVLAFLSAIFLGSMTEAFNTTEGGWGDLVVSVVKSVVYVALSIWVARRMGVATRTGPPPGTATEPIVLATSEGPM